MILLFVKFFRKYLSIRFFWWTHQTFSISDTKLDFTNFHGQCEVSRTDVDSGRLAETALSMKMCSPRKDRVSTFDIFWIKYFAWFRCLILLSRSGVREGGARWYAYVGISLYIEMYPTTEIPFTLSAGPARAARPQPHDFRAKVLGKTLARHQQWGSRHLMFTWAAMLTVNPSHIEMFGIHTSY